LEEEEKIKRSKGGRIRRYKRIRSDVCGERGKKRYIRED
jgi:hypothetical protein